jgi:flagellar basal body-associated protein FliL
LLFPSAVPTASKTANQAPPTTRTGIIFLFVLAAVVAALGAGFWGTQRTRSEASTGGGGEVKGTLHLETFVLNLADPGQRSYLRVGIDLGLSRELGRGENALPVGPVRDTILGVLGQSQADELVTAKGKAKLKEDLLHALQQRVPGLGIEEVYFTEFLIQR